MGVLKTRVIWYPNRGKGTPVDIDDFTNINVKLGTDGKSNVTDISLKNPFGLYNDSLGAIQFNEKDVVKIYAKLTDDDSDINISSDTNLLTITNIQEWNGEVTNKSTQYKLKCIDRTYELLNKVWAGSYTNKTSPYVIQNVVQSVTEIPSGVPSEFYYTNGSKNYYIDSWTYVDALRPNGSAFPDEINLGMSFKPIYEWVNTLSQVENTNYATETINNTQVCTKPFIFYVDEKNKLHWNYPSSTISYYFEEGKQASSVDYSKSNFSTEIINSNCTSSSTNKIICSTTTFQTKGVVAGMYVYVPSALTEDLRWSKVLSVDSETQITLDENVNITNGSRFYVYPAVSSDVMNINMTRATFDVVNFIIFQSGKDMNDYGILHYKYSQNTTSDFKMLYKEWPKIAQNLLARDYSEGLDASGRQNGGGTYEKPEYPSSYPYTPIWTTTAVNSDLQYNLSLRAAAKKEGTSRAENIINKYSAPRYKGKITISGLKIQPGVLIKFTSSSLGMLNLFLRIKDVTHTINENSWTTTLDLEEDSITTGA